MIRTPAWAYLDTLVSRRRSVEFKSSDCGGFVVVVGGFHFGTGPSCKSALVAASKNRKKWKAKYG